MQLESIGSSVYADRQDPLHVLLQYINERAPDCDMALVHDDDLACISGDSLDSLKPDVLMDSLRSSAPEVGQIQCDSFDGDGSRTGLGAVPPITKVATLFKDGFSLPLSPHLKSTDLSGKVSKISDHIEIEGWFLDFYLGEWTRGGGHVALGRLRDSSPASNKHFKERIEDWLGLHHSNVLSFFGHVEIEGVVYSVSPWMKNRTIREYFQGNPGADRTRLLNQVASGVEFLHANGIVHGDLCGKNVLINDDGTALICGFNLSDFASPTSDIARTRWLAPEQITSGSAARPTEMADIWSFGSLCLEVFTGREPYSYYSDLKVPLLLSDGIPPENREFTVIGVSTKIWELVQSCWRVNPAERPSMSTVHLTITGILSLHDLPHPGPSRYLETPLRYQPFGMIKPQTATTKIPDMGAPQFPRSASMSTFSPPSRKWEPVSSGVLNSMEKVASESECLLLSAVDGAVSAGNLEGLVSRIITGTTDSAGDDHFRDVFLTIYQLFATSERLLEVLYGQFELSDLHPSDDASSRVLLFVGSWLNKGFEDEELKCSSSVKEFILTIAHSGEAKAMEIASMVENPDYVLLRQPGYCTQLRRTPAERPEGVTPTDLATALTVVEGDRFKCITYWDFVKFIRGATNTQRIELSTTTHDLVKAWVQRAVLHSSHLHDRMRVYEEWIYTAQACRGLNNFSSASAIVIALKSPIITALVLTCESRAEHILHGLARDLMPTDGMYQNSLQQTATKDLVPWLDPHLSSLNSTFARCNPIVEVDGRPLIDFKVCSELAEQINTLVQFSPPSVRDAARPDVLAYVEYSLESSTGDEILRDAEARSAELAAEEQSLLEHRARMRFIEFLSAT
ncbi:hypothetical protein BC826DRAFT_272338 [Russula brevipes]|nr:hypothetical protein BC826DRAFT_272338 [Russula brevipes]